MIFHKSLNEKYGPPQCREDLRRLRIQNNWNELCLWCIGLVPVLAIACVVLVIRSL